MLNLLILVKNTAIKPWRPQQSHYNTSFYMPGIEIKPSLNSEKRKRELNRINHENNELLKRLQMK